MEDDFIYCTWTYRESLPPETRYQFRDLDHLVRTLCCSAKKQLYLVAPYLSTQGLVALRPAIAVSAQRGARIRLLTSDLGSPNTANWKALKSLQEGEDGELIKSKLRVLCATDKLPALVHAKIILADDDAGYLGSANFSQSALDQNFELGASLTSNQVRSLRALLNFLESRGLIAEKHGTHQ